jgi:diguanylate cyclase (GGDEF)-like protein
MDSLTGLRDRAEILASLDAELQQHSDNSILAVLIINISRFRYINAVHGYHVADMVLSETARRIQSVIRKQDITGRIGADEFAVILPGLKSPYFAELRSPGC